MAFCLVARLQAISIHALLAESDRCLPKSQLILQPFLSTLSLRRATCQLLKRQNQPFHFYPRSPCGERRQLLQASGRNLYFYPRSPCGERPKPCTRLSGRNTISIHALLAESDRPICACTAQHPDFYPRSPCGERLSSPNTSIIILDISIHALLAESDPTICNGILPTP